MKMKKQIAALFLCNFAILFIGFGLFPLLPVYASEFGATPPMIGVYLAITYIAISLGNLLPGWLSGRTSQKLVFVSAGFIGVPALILLGRAAELWQVVALTGTVWFTGGVGIALVSVFTSRLVDKSQRGKLFSLIALTTPLGAMIGGVAVAWLVEAQGYRLMFTVLGLVYAFWPVIGLLVVKDQPASLAASTRSRSVTQAHPGRTFTLLLLSVLLVAMTISISRLGLSLSMKAAMFSPAAIAGTNMVGGLVTIPIVLGFGLLSDRLGRKLLLALGCLLAALSTVLLISANQLWHFWVVSAAMLAARSISGSLASALASDFLAPEVLGEALPRLTSMNWVAGVLGFAGSGYVMETLGRSSLYWMATIFSLAAAAIIGLMIRQDQRPVPEPSPSRADCLSPCVEGSGAD
jgi:MFS family permease